MEKEQDFDCDPLRILHFDVYDLIFQHVSPQNLLKSSEVNPLWYLSIGNSQKCMKKIRIHLSYRNANCNLHSISERKYRNICADFSQYEQKDVLRILSMPQQNWQSVEFYNGNFESANFIKNFSETVESLSLIRVNVKEKVAEENVSNFPRLKSLKMIESSSELIRNCSNLSSLEIRKSSSDCKFLRSILMKNKKLKKLSIFDGSLHSSLFWQITFTLCELRIGSSTQITEEDQKIFNDFLTRQSPSLQIIALNSWFGLRVIKTCFVDMPRLTDFSFTQNDELIDWKNIELTTNSSITRLCVSKISDVFICATPNLKVFKTEKLEFDDLNCLVQRCNNLEELYVETFDVSELPKLNSFPKLKKFKSWDVDENLMNKLKKNNSRNHFEELIFHN